MPADPRLLALPSLRRQAEADARELYEVSGGNWDTATHLAWGEPMRLIEFCAALLADLNRWQSQAWALRRIAELLGWDCGEEVPIITLSANGGWLVGIYRPETQSVWLNAVIFQLPPETYARPEAIAAILLHLEGQK